MLNLYRRHSSTCKHRGKGQNYTGCSCPIWVDGKLNGRRFRKGTGLRDRARAVKRVERWEQAPATAAPENERTLAQAVDSYLNDCRARDLRDSTLTGYQKTLEHLIDYCRGIGTTRIEDLDLAVLTDFRASREVAPSTSRKELETLRGFCQFARKRGWLADNYARDLTPPKEQRAETQPFSHDEVTRILDACGRLDNPNQRSIPRARARARAAVLVMLNSGLRISDLAELRHDAVNLKSGKMLLRVMKTGRRQYIRLWGPPR